MGTPKNCRTAAPAEKRICCLGSQSLHEPGPSHASWAERPLHGSHMCLASWLGFALPPVHTLGLSTCWAPACQCLGSGAATHLPQGPVRFPGPALQPPGPKPTQLGLGSPEPSSQRDSASPAPTVGLFPPTAFPWAPGGAPCPTASCSQPSCPPTCHIRACRPTLTRAGRPGMQDVGLPLGFMTHSQGCQSCSASW